MSEPHETGPAGTGPDEPLRPGQYPPGGAYPPTPPPAAGRADSRVVMAALIGFGFAAVIAIVLASFGALPTRTVGPSGASLTLPAKVGQFTRLVDNAHLQHGKGAQQIPVTRASDRQTAQALSNAHQGAGAAVQTYANTSLQTEVQLWAVRAQTPTPVVRIQNAKFEGLAEPLTEVKTFGAVACTLNNQPEPRGHPEKASDVFVVSCQRTSASLTVSIVLGGTGAIVHDPQRVVKLVNQVWPKL
jgi:hypothetical protein